MNDDTLLKVKYTQLYNELKSIKDKLNDLDMVYNELNNALKETLMLDDKIIEEDMFKSIKEETNSIRSELVDFIIPEVSKRM